MAAPWKFLPCDSCCTVPCEVCYPASAEEIQVTIPASVFQLTPFYGFSNPDCGTAPCATVGGAYVLTPSETACQWNYRNDSWYTCAGGAVWYLDITLSFSVFDGVNCTAALVVEVGRTSWGSATVLWNHTYDGSERTDWTLEYFSQGANAQALCTPAAASYASVYAEVL